MSVWTNLSIVAAWPRKLIPNAFFASEQSLSSSSSFSFPCFFNCIILVRRAEVGLVSSWLVDFCEPIIHF